MPKKLYYYQGIITDIDWCIIFKLFMPKNYHYQISSFIVITGSTSLDSCSLTISGVVSSRMIKMTFNWSHIYDPFDH